MASWDLLRNSGGLCRIWRFGTLGESRGACLRGPGLSPGFPCVWKSECLKELSLPIALTLGCTLPINRCSLKPVWICICVTQTWHVCTCQRANDYGCAGMERDFFCVLYYASTTDFHCCKHCHSTWHAHAHTYILYIHTYIYIYIYLFLCTTILYNMWYMFKWTILIYQGCNWYHYVSRTFLWTILWLYPTELSLLASSLMLMLLLLLVFGCLLIFVILLSLVVLLLQLLLLLLMFLL